MSDNACFRQLTSTSGLSVTRTLAQNEARLTERPQPNSR